MLAAAAGPTGPAAQGPSSGRWREKVRVVWDEGTQATARRPVRVFDPHPELDLDFQWEPSAGAGTDAQGTVYGPGRLTWRQRGSSAWDGAAAASDYVGEMKDGRPDGMGRITLRSGLSYEGEWKDGLMEGRGHLRLPNGDDYEGDFVADRPHGNGRYTAADGTTFDGPFRNGQREGTGVLTLADGAAYHSRWENGREVTRTLVMQGGAPASVGIGGGGVAVNLFVDLKRNTEYRNVDPDLPSYLYQGALAGNVVKLRPESQQVMGLWKGDGIISRIRGRMSNELFEAAPQFGPVFLVLDVTNERGLAVQIDGAYLEVEQSYTDLQPYVTIQSDHSPGAGTCFGGLNPIFELVNSGWGPVRNASLTYAFGNESGPRTQSFTVRAGDFADSQQVSTQGGLEAAGLDVGRLEEGSTFECPSGDQLPSCLAEVEESGVLGELSEALFLDGSCLTTRVTGKITYEWVDAQGASHRRQSPIAVDIPVLHFDLGQGAEEGAGGPVERNVRPVKLALDRSNYRLPVGIQGRLAPRENRRFALSLSADKSSAHFFKVVLQLADGSTVSSRRVDLLYFRPNVPAYEPEPFP